MKIKCSTHVRITSQLFSVFPFLFFFFLYLQSYFIKRFIINGEWLCVNVRISRFEARGKFGKYECLKPSSVVKSQVKPQYGSSKIMVFTVVR